MTNNLTNDDIQNGPEKIPKKAMRLGDFGNYELWYDGEKDKMVFFTTDYHPGTLVLSKAGLEKMIAVLTLQITPEEIISRDSSSQ
jgi:hypothetical protein